MKALKVLTLAFLTTALSGCISSISPLFTEEDLIFNSDLLGDWSDGESSLSFSRKGEKTYILISSDGIPREAYETHLVKLDNSTFLDIYPLDALSESYFYRLTNIPVHSFFKIEISQEEIIISEIDPELLDSLINDSQFDISYIESQEGHILLTASTKKIQSFIQKNEGLFTNPGVFRKRNN